MRKDWKMLKILNFNCFFLALSKKEAGKGSDYQMFIDSQNDCVYFCDGWPYKRCTMQTTDGSSGRCEPPYESRRNKCLFSRFPKKVTFFVN